MKPFLEYLALEKGMSPRTVEAYGRDVAGFLATAVAFVFALDSALADGSPASYGRGDGIVLLLLLTVFIHYTTMEILRQRESGSREVGLAPGSWSIPVSLALGTAGLVALVVGARLTVEGAVGIARSVGISEAVIGLTVIAIGTSLPELAASLVAAWRGHAGMAIGNVIGSNLFNLLLVLGVTATIRPIPIPEFGLVDLTVLSALSVLLWVVCASPGRRIIRVEGALLLATYLAYLSFRALS